jgi:hypothetical protein
MILSTVLTLLACIGSGFAAVTSNPSVASGKTFDYIVVRGFPDFP